MDEFMNSVIKNRWNITTLYCYFGQKEDECIFKTPISEQRRDNLISQFIKYPIEKGDYRHIISLDKELKVYTEHTICKRTMSCYLENINVDSNSNSNSDNSVYFIANREEILTEIDFPSRKYYQKNERCNDIIFKLNPKINLVVSTENNIISVYLVATIDDYIDTTLQSYTEFVNQIAKILY